MKTRASAAPLVRVSHLPAAVALVVLSTIFLALAATDLHDELETKFSLTVYFKAREALGRSATVSPKLKLFSYDDTTVSKVGSPDLPLSTWAKLLSGLAARNPQVVLIDKLFALAPNASPEEEAAIAALAKIQQKIVTTAFVSPSEIRFREPLDTTGPAYRLKSYFVAPGVEPMMRDGFLPAADFRRQKPYGPDKRLAAAFRSPGHSLNAGFGKAQALLDLAPGVVLPHMALLGARQLKIHQHKLVVDGEQIVPLDSRGRMIVDFPSPMTLFKSAKRLLPLLDAAQSGAPMTQVEPGDWVLILPAMYTGNTDFTVTPLGPMPGPFVVAALANSLLKRQWVAPLGAEASVVVLAIVLGLVLVGYTRWPAWAPLIIVPFAWIAGSIIMFAYFHTLTDLTTPTLAFLAAGGFASAQRSGMREKLVLFMRLLKTENERLAMELEQAGQIASAFRPHRPPRLVGLDIGAFHQSLDGASGDWYAFETSASGRFLHVIMCDISGHGVQAAIVVSTCKTVLSIMQRNSAEFESRDFIRHYAELLNATLFKHGRGGHTTTLAGLTFDRDAGSCLFLCAGHPPPIVLRAEAQEKKSAVELLMSSHNILGISATMKVELGETVLARKDHVLLFTDGVKFPRNSRRIEKRLRELTVLKPESAAPLLCRMDWGERDSAKESTAVAVPDDDVSLVWIAANEDWLRPRPAEDAA